MELKKNTHSDLKQLSKFSSIFQLHIYVRPQFLCIFQPKQHKKSNVEANTRIRLSFTKVDNKQIGRNIKQCHCHSSHYFLFCQLHGRQRLEQHRGTTPAILAPTGLAHRGLHVHPQSAVSEDWVWCKFSSNRRCHLCKCIRTQDDSIAQLVARPEISDPSDGGHHRERERMA